jgi:clan AA aspartic protease (TIGR02281 family)
MRYLLAACLIGLAACGAADAASLDPQRIAAIDQAAEQFAARAATAAKLGQVPRQADPEVRRLLDTVFDTGDVSHGAAPPADFPKLNDWLGRIVAVGRVYLSAGRAAHDFGIFGAELGRFFDASVAVQEAMVDCRTAELDAQPDAKLPPAELRKLTQLRGAVGDALGDMIGMLRVPGLTVGWVHERVTALTAAAPSMARFLPPATLARLRAAIFRLAGSLRDKPLRTALAGLAEALAEPSAPAAPVAEGAPGSAEIALEGDGRSYSVPVRVNGAMKFIVDSGASVVVLPSDLVDALTKAGAIAPGDLLGPAGYVTADGRKHRGARLMLRELDVGGHIVRNIVASVTPAHASPLLGQSFLAKFKSWTLDNRRHALIITE